MQAPDEEKTEEKAVAKTISKVTRDDFSAWLEETLITIEKEEGQVLIPIHMVREKLEDPHMELNFDRWLLEFETEGKITLQTHSAPRRVIRSLRARSIQIHSRGLIYYVMRR
jgi:hypothetical protein